jgi:hypothetical protein
LRLSVGKAEEEHPRCRQNPFSTTWDALPQQCLKTDHFEAA